MKCCVISFERASVNSQSMEKRAAIVIDDFNLCMESVYSNPAIF